MDARIGIGIIGGTGYGAGELLRLLRTHPAAQIVSVTTTSKVGEPVTAVHTHLHSLYELSFASDVDFERLASFPQRVIFVALPHGASAGAINSLLQRKELEGCKVIDLSGDFRLRSRTQRERHYPEAHAEEKVRDRFVYGLSELAPDSVRKASAVANPGCLASACILAVRPFIDRLKGSQIVFDAKTGTSGAGKTPTETTHHATRHGNLAAYKILEHRHEPEIRQGLGDTDGTTLQTMFVPHLLPVARGIFVSAYGTLKQPESTAALTEELKRFYADCPFIRVRSGTPQLQDVLGSNYRDISVNVRETQVVVMSVLDNLVKGMAGQAIQNMNLMCGLPETTGLLTSALGPY